MTIISNSFAPACRHLPQKYTISTLQSVDTADNQDSYERIFKLSRFSSETVVGTMLSYIVDTIVSTIAVFAICVAKLRIFFEVVKPRFFHQS